ncbi:MAG TPA: YkgJ family cysteine cluster protein [Geobacteraceae bacterium]|nr:YkgJ family cysteine cluster protein [Geobacteraceae bacterium]
MTVSRDVRSWDGLLVELEKQRQFMDMLTRSLVTGYESRGGRIYCAKGCSGCCSLVVNCALTEAVAVAATLDERQAALVDAYVDRLQGLVAGAADLKEYLRLHRQSSGGCPLLGKDGSCGIYGVRPLSCRALLSTRESRWCSADFAALTHEEKQAFVEGLDREAVAFPMHYLASSRDAGAELENRLSMLTALAFGFSIYGNMPVLVHLVKRHDLARVAAEGRSAVEALLAAAGLDSPLVLQVNGI